MEIHFADRKLKEICQVKRVAEKKLGTNCARKLSRRLQELAAVEKVSDLVVGRPHPLTGNRAGQMALDLDGAYRLVFASANSPCPIYPDGAINWTQVTIVEIQYIGDYHG